MRSARRRSRPRRPRSFRARTGIGARCSRSIRAAFSRTRRRPICSTASPRRSTCCSPKGLDQVFARHDRLAEATRRAVAAWGLEILCADPALYSSTLTGVMMPEGHNADAFRKVVLERFDMSLGQGLGKVAGKVFRIGHLGHFNDLMLCGHAGRRRDGAGAGGRSAPQRRRPGSARLSRGGGPRRTIADEPRKRSAV